MSALGNIRPGELITRRLTPAECPVVTTEKVRYADTDRQGQVNNALFATFCETGRVEALYDSAQPLAAESGEFVTAALNLSFLGEILWPGKVEIGTYLEKIGESSLRIGQVLYQEGRCVAEAESVIVDIDGKTRRALPLSSQARAHLAGLVLES